MDQGGTAKTPNAVTTAESLPQASSAALDTKQIEDRHSPAKLEYSPTLERVGTLPSPRQWEPKPNLIIGPGA